MRLYLPLFISFGFILFHAIVSKKRILCLSFVTAFVYTIFVCWIGPHYDFTFMLGLICIMFWLMLLAVFITRSHYD